MLKHKFLSVVFVLISICGAVAAENVTEVELQKGEKWWGLSYDGSVEQPMVKPFEETVVVDPAGFKMPIGVMISSTGRYIYSSVPMKVDFDGDKFIITSAVEKVEVQKGGKSLREAYVVCALKNFTPGEAPDAEMFALPVYETAYEFGYAQGESEIIGYAEKLLAEGFPSGIIVIADGWQKVNGPYEFDTDLYPDPKGMVDKLHGLGFKVMLTVTPFVPKWGRTFATALKNGQILGEQYRNGATEYAVLDMGNEAQFERLKTGVDKIKAAYGFDGFRFDCGDDVPHDGKFMENMMGLRGDMTLVSFWGMRQGQYVPYVGEIGPGSLNEDMYLSALRNVIAGGIMGYPYMQSVLYTPLVLTDQRSMADFLLLQCGMPVMSVDFAPWRITDQAMYANVKAAVNFRASLAEYVRKLVADSRRTGEPLARHMEYQFPKSGFFDCDDQFMLGPKYLFAPCVDGADKRMVRFPKGTWVGRNGEKVKGPVVKQVDCSAGELVYYESVR